MRRRFLCLLGLVWVMASGGAATAATLDPSCTFPAQRAVDALTPGSYQSRALWPRIRPNEERADGFGQSGFEVLAQYEFCRRR